MRLTERLYAFRASDNSSPGGLRSVARLHGEIRMQHNGKVRSVPWDRLYVAPSLHVEAREDATVEVHELAAPGPRHVILGDLGAGKSTLTEKLASDLAADPAGMIVPFSLCFVISRRPLRPASEP